MPGLDESGPHRLTGINDEGLEASAQMLGFDESEPPRVRVDH